MSQRCKCGTKAKVCSPYRAYSTGYCRECDHAKVCHDEKEAKKKPSAN